MYQKSPSALSTGCSVLPPWRSVLFSVFLAFCFCLVSGTTTYAKSETLDMETLNVRAVETLEAKGLSVKQVALGSNHSAAVTSDGRLYTWGYGASGRLGLGKEWGVKTAWTPQLVPGLSDVKQVALGDHTSAAVTSDGSLYAWGFGYYGELGIGEAMGNMDGIYTPQLVPGLSDVKQVALGWEAGAAVTNGGELYTWGRGPTGHSSSSGRDPFSPQLVPGISDVKQVDLEYYHGAAVTSGGGLYVWGSGNEGQLGLGEEWWMKSSETPQLMPDLFNVEQVALGNAHSAAVTSEGKLYVWGEGDTRLGLGDEWAGKGNVCTPQLVPNLSDVKQVSLGISHSAAVTSDGKLYMWGSGELGLGEGFEINYRWAPQLVPSLSDVKQVALGSNYSAAITSGGKLYMWGDGEYGELGLGKEWKDKKAYTPQLVPIFSGSSTEPLKQQSSVILPSSNLTLEVHGGPKELAIGGAGDGKISATSSDSSVATVAVDGTTLIIRPVGAGDSEITISRAETENYTASSAMLHVMVKKAETGDPSTVILSPNQLMLTVKDGPNMVSVGGTGDGALSAESSNVDVATVSIQGTTLTVTPVGEGTCSITVSRAATENFAASTATLNVVVRAIQNDPGTGDDPSPSPEGDGVLIYRVYNKYTGEHIFTTERSEYDDLGTAGWQKEGVAWTAPATSDVPVYRLYNKWSGDHHFTTSYTEYDGLGKAGWKQEGIAFYSADTDGMPVYRLYNPYVKVGTHHYATSRTEYDGLGLAGWEQEGIGWYGVK